MQTDQENDGFGLLGCHKIPRDCPVYMLRLGCSPTKPEHLRCMAAAFGIGLGILVASQVSTENAGHARSTPMMKKLLRKMSVTP